MDRRSPLRRRTRRLLTLAFAVCALAPLAFFARMGQEPSVAFGFDALSDRAVAHVTPGSPADRAGLLPGDTLLVSERERWLISSRPDSLIVRRGAHEVTLHFEDDQPSFVQRLGRIGGYRYVLLGVGLLTLVFGVWVTGRNPDAPYIVPFALWSASVALAYPIIGPSALWGLPMWTLFTVWEIVLAGLFQALSLHWLLRFPTRLGGPRLILGIYALALGGMVLLLAVALTSGRYPAVGLHARALLAGLAVLVVCGMQFARAPSRRAKRQVAWVLTAVVIYAALDVALWELPTVLGIANVASLATLNATLGATYLLIPLAIGIAVTREGLFGIDRLVTPGLSYGLSIAVLGLAYAGLAVGLSHGLGRADGSLPVGAGVMLAAGLSGLLLPLQRRVFAGLDRVFNRQERRLRAIPEALDARLDSVVDADGLREALTQTVRYYLGVPCQIGPAAQGLVARPGALDLADPSGVRLDAGLDATLVVPLSAGLGSLRLGPRADGARYHDDHLALFADLDRRTARAADRLRLLREVGERDLALAHTRLRIAGDLHDDIGASLSSMAVLSDLVRRNDDLPDADRARLDRLSSSARDLVDDLRDIVWAIDPKADHLHDLAERLRDTASVLLPGVRCIVEAPDDLPLDMETRRHVFLIAKEALHNAARHAEATRVHVRLGTEAGTLRLEVRDDGHGFDPLVSSTGHGLGSLRQRAEILGGTVTVESAPGEGTRVLLQAPLGYDGVNAP
ncbi:MAG: ATP-binding protein [Bacteroidota bacterium]